ncbi:MAG TPA: ABC transporter ATP-binding protein, partial [Devosia sp.]|nr:ABC transporter ATP-binding protein [Devosia sp.]
KYANQFSGGELQRISIARALIPSPSLIVADEPVSMIDASRRMIIINMFKRLRDEAGRSFLYITHDLATAYYISDYVAVMSKGQVVEFGSANAVMGNPQHAYTRLLLDSIPTTRQRWRPRTPIAPAH